MKNHFGVKKIIFAFTFHLILSLTVISTAISQSYPFFSLSQYSNLNISHFKISFSENQDLSVENESEKSDAIQKSNNLNGLKEETKTRHQPSSSKISIGLGKALFEKYIK
jgi:hypothetical protein